MRVECVQLPGSFLCCTPCVSITFLGGVAPLFAWAPVSPMLFRSMLCCVLSLSLSLCVCVCVPPLGVLYTLSGRQGSHDGLKGDQGGGVGGKGAQEGGQKPPPVAPEAGLTPDGGAGIAPSGEAAGAVCEAAAEGVSHDALLDQVGRVADEPEELCAEAAGPEVDGWDGHSSVGAHPAGQDVVAAPPDEEEAAEEHRRTEPVVEAAAQAVGGVDLADAVDWARVGAVGPPSAVLDLQPRLDVLDGRGDEADGPASEDARKPVAEGGHGRLGRDPERALGQQPPVDIERSQHDGIHHHPAHQRWRRALVQAAHPLARDSLRHALQRPTEPGRVGRLQAHLDRVEGVADYPLAVSQ